MTKAGYREKCLAQKINTCNACGSDGELVVHHINGDGVDDRLENLVPLCRECHGKVHAPSESEGRIQELRDQLPDSSKYFDRGVESHGPKPIDESDFRHPSPDINDTQEHILGYLRSEGDVRRRELVSELEYTGQTIDRNLRGLRICGWVERVRRGVYCYVEEDDSQ